MLARLPEPPTDAQLRDWARPDCINTGKYAGFDYARALERAIQKSRAFARGPEDHSLGCRYPSLSISAIAAAGARSLAPEMK